MSGGKSTDFTLEIGHLKDEHSRAMASLETRNMNSSQVVQFLIIIFGAGALAAAKFPVAFCSVPIFWSGWLLQMVSMDQDSLKLAAYARWLEARLNERLKDAGQRPVYEFEQKLAKRHGPRQPTHVALYVYGMTINVVSWIIGAVVLSRATSWPIGALFILPGAATWTVALRSVMSRDWLFEEYARVLDEREHTASEVAAGRSSPGG
jgi:hypothetical protein